MKTLVHCVIFENVVVYLLCIASVLFSFDSLRSSWAASIVLGSWLLLVTVSIAALFVNRELASFGFLVALIGFVIGILWPAL